MLSIARVKDPSAHYYFADRAREIAETPPGYWLGTHAANLAKVGAVEPADLTRVLCGRHLLSAAPLIDEATARGYDLVVATPKSVSVLFALGGEAVRGLVLDAHRSAVDALVTHMERRVVAVKGRALATSGVIAAGFEHGASRSGDPHLHTHVVLAALVHGDDGRYAGLDGRALLAHRSALGALYDAHLRHCLGASLVVDFHRARSGGIEIAQVDPMLRGVFSGRSAELRGRRFDGEGRAARFAGRDPKRDDLDANGWRERWLAQARAFEIPAPPVTVREPLGVDPLVGSGAQRSVRIDERHFSWSLGHESITRRGALRALARSVLPGARVETLDSAIDALAPFGPGRALNEGRVAPSLLRVDPAVEQRLGPRPLEPASLGRWLAAREFVEDERVRVARGMDRSTNTDWSVPSRDLRFS